MGLGSVAQAEDYRLPPSSSGDALGVELTPWLRVKPYARLTGTHTNNLLQEESDLRQSETLFMGTGGAIFEFTGDERSLTLGYAATLQMHAREADFNTVTHMVSLAGAATLGRFSTEVQGVGNWGVTNTDPRFTGRVRNFAGQVSGEIAWQPSESFGAVVDGDASYRENFKTVLEPFNTLTWRTGVFGTYTPNLPVKTRFDLGVQFRQVHYVDHAATNPDLEFVGGAVGAKVSHGVVSGQVRVGYEYGWVGKRNLAPRLEQAFIIGGGGATGPVFRARPTADVRGGLFASGSVTWEVFRNTSLGFSGRHSLGYSSAALWQRRTNLGFQITQGLPGRLSAFGSVNWDLQQPRRSPNLRTQAYVVGLTWDVLPPNVDLGAQTSYIRSSSRTGHFETFSTTIGATLRY